MAGEKTIGSKSAHEQSDKAAPAARAWPRRLLWGAGIILLCIVFIIVALRMFITTAPGHRFIEQQLNSRSLGPIEGLAIDGLSGDPLGRLRVGSLSVRDKSGVWMTADDIVVDWSPWAFLSGHIKINRAEIAAMTIIRQPELNTTTPNDSRALTISAPELGIKTLSFDEAVFGQAAAFTVNAGVMLNETQKTLSLDAQRLDTVAGADDAIRLSLQQEDNGNITGEFDLRGAANAPLSTLLRAPAGQSVTGTGQINGTDETGTGQLSLRFGEQLDAIDAAVSWDKASVQIDAAARAEAWPMLSDYRSVLGETTTLSATLDRAAALQSFVVQITGSGIEAKATGTLPSSESDSPIPDVADITLRLAAPQTLMDLPEGYALGAIEVTGKLRREPELAFPVLAFDGTASVRDLASPYGSAGRVIGPVKLSRAGQAPVSFNLDLKASGVAPTQDIPIAITDSVSLTATGRYDLDGQIMTLDKGVIITGNNRAAANGRVNMRAETYDVSGGVTLAVKAKDAIPAGQLQADYRVNKTRNSAPALSSNGRFNLETPLSGPLGELLGQAVIFNTRMTPIENGVKINEATVEAAAIRAAAQGRISDRFDLSIEALSRAAFTVGGVDIGEDAEISATVTGNRDTPNLRAQAAVSQITAAGQTLADLHIKIDLADALTAPKGPVELSAQTEYGPLLSSMQFASRGDIIRADEISLRLGALTAGGAVQYLPSGLIDGTLSLDLPQTENSRANATLALSAGNNGTQAITLDASGKNIVLADFEIDDLSAKASGTLSALGGTVNFKGRYRDGIFSRPIALAAPFTFSNDNDALSLSTTPEGRYAAVDLTHRDAVTVNYTQGQLTVLAPLNVSGQPLTLDYRRGQSAETLKLSAQDMPMTLLPLPAVLADSVGLWSANIDLSTGVKDGLFGTAAIDIVDWRGFGAEARSGLTLALTSDISARNANISITGNSPSGFDIDGNLAVPLSSGDSLVSIGVDMARALTGQLRANGAAQSVLGLALPATVDLDGSLDLLIDITGTLAAPKIQGRSTGEGLQFEAPDLGTQIRDGQFTAEFDNENLRLTNVKFNDAQDGNASGQGEFRLGELGRPIGTLSLTTQRFNIIDRRDANARMSGSVSYESLAKRSKISGDIRIGEATVKQLTAGGASVIEIEVEEINRPESLKSTSSADASAPVLPIDLDIKVNAPRKIFIRSRGLDVELSANVTIGGTVSEPSITGRAEIVRGGYNIAGKTLAFSSGSIVFDGPISTARIALTAQAETSNLTASVSIDGTVENPEITLSSTPERPDDEILSALLFGRSATELSAIEAAQLAGALAQFSGNGVGFDLLGGLRDSLGIAELSVGVTEDGSAQITGGRYLARNVYLQVFSGAGADQTGAVISWELRRNIALRSKIQADNEQSLSLRYKWDF